MLTVVAGSHQQCLHLEFCPHAHYSTSCLFHPVFQLGESDLDFKASLSGCGFKLVSELGTVSATRQSLLAESKP